MANFVEHSVLPLYHERGYLKASCATPQPKVVKLPAADSTDNKQPPTYVDITFPLTPGIQYKVTQWEWSENQAIPKDQLDPFLHARTGQPANTVQLANDLREVQTLYGSRGYILATIRVNAEFDDIAATVFYHLIVHEDSLYRMGDLEFRGIDNSLTARLRAAWKLRPGDIYDATYLKQFLPEARKLLHPPSTGVSIPTSPPSPATKPSTSTCNTPPKRLPKAAEGSISHWILSLRPLPTPAKRREGRRNLLSIRPLQLRVERAIFAS